MAEPGRIPYADAISAIAVPKGWAGASRILWKIQGGNGFPESYKCRAPLSVNGVVQEGYFVDLFYKFSALHGVPDKVSMTLVTNGARVLALDENGPSDHVNTVGKGHEFYGKNADHPHLHVPVPESSSGYAEPIDRIEIGALWKIFLERANIEGAPPFTLPPRKPQADSGQMDLL
jgi:hypothetical protein